MNVTSQRIEGWKSIAAYFRRDRTTVMRWAQSRGLPVRRLPGGGSSSVYAFAHELDQWLAKAGDDTVELPDSPPTLADPPVPAPEPAAANAAAASTESLAPVPLPLPPRRGQRLWYAGGGLGLAVLALAAVSLSGQPSTRQARQAVGSSNATTFPADPEVAALYVEARANWALRSADGLHKAVDGFGQVVSRDPQFAPGYTGLADAYLLIREFDAMPDATAYARAEAAAKAALAIDPGLADAHRALGFIQYWWHHDTVAAAASFTKALALDPRNAQTHFWFGNCLVDNGESKAGLDHLDKARLLNPESNAIKADHAWALWLSGQRPKARAILEAQAKARPEDVGPHTYLMYVYMIDGDWPGYLREADLRADNRQDPAMQRHSKMLRDTYQRGGAEALIKALMQDAATDRAAGLSESSIRLANWAAATGRRAELVTILADSDRRRQQWGLGSFAPMAVSNMPGDLHLAGLLANRRSPPMVGS